MEKMKPLAERFIEFKKVPTWNLSNEIPEYPGKSPRDRISKIQTAYTFRIELGERPDEQEVAKMKELIRSGVPLPAILVELSGEYEDDSDTLSVIDGNTRLQAASELGAREVPVRVVVQAEDYMAIKESGGPQIKQPKVPGPRIAMEGIFKMVFSMVHLLGPNGEAWDLRFEDYPMEDRAGDMLRWVGALPDKALYGKKDGKIYRLGYGVNAEEVQSIPSGAQILPDYWTKYLKIGT